MVYILAKIKYFYRNGYYDNGCYDKCFKKTYLNCEIS